MSKVLAYLKQAKWILWVVLAAGFAVVVILVRRLFSGPPSTGPTSLPTVPPALQAKVEKAEEEALKARIEATVHADEDRKEIEEISKIPDGKERRKRLSDKLKSF